MLTSMNTTQTPNARLNNQPIFATYPCDFSFEVELSRQKNVLTPFAAPSHKGKQTFSKVGFNIKIKKCRADSFTIEVIDKGKVIYNESLSGEALNKGSHFWEWDGFSNEQILNSKVLKSKELKVTFIGTKNGISQKETIKLNNRAKHVEWLNCIIDKQKSRVIVDMTVLCTLGEDIGSCPQGMAPISYKRFKSYVKQGFEYYWQRSGDKAVTTPEGKVSVTAQLSMLDTDSEHTVQAPDYELVRNYTDSNTASWTNTSNLKGRINYRATADDPRLLLYYSAAHEIGHSILLSYGDNYGVEHKGTSHKPKRLAPDESIDHKTHQPNKENQPIPESGEIDIMKYYEGFNPRESDQLIRMIADEHDVVGLLWLCSIKFAEAGE